MRYTSEDRNKESLSVRINGSNRLHHIWNNNGMWWIHFTLHQGPTKKRKRTSLRTKDMEKAIVKRDQYLARLGLPVMTGDGAPDPSRPIAIAA